MRPFLLLALLASRLGAQAASQTRIPIKKETAKVGSAAGIVERPPVVIHDTIVVYKTDSLNVFQSAVASPLPDVAVPAACRSLFVPIPIPIPFGHHSSASTTTAGTTTTALGTTTTPEPASLVLVGTGLLGLSVLARKKIKSL
jgi:hypothetical protein